METKDCILTRRSVRKFTDRKVEHRLVEQIISLAAYAPSWKNTQTAGYIVVESREMKEKLMAALPPYNAKTVATAPVAVVMTARKDAAATTGMEASPHKRATAGRCLTQVLPTRPSAWPHTAKASAASFWAFLMISCSANMFRFRKTSVSPI